MKKILLLVLLIGMPCMAQEITTNRAIKEISDKCKNTISVNNYLTDMSGCLLNTAQSEYIWREGWSNRVHGDVIKILAGSQDIPPTLLPEQEKIIRKTFQNNLASAFLVIHQKFVSNGGNNLKMTPEVVKMWR